MGPRYVIDGNGRILMDLKGHYRSPAPGLPRSVMEVCGIPEFDSGKSPVQLAAGASGPSGTSPVGTSVYRFTGAMGGAYFTGMWFDGNTATPPSMPKAVVWRFEAIFASGEWDAAGQAKQLPVVQYVGQQLAYVPIFLPCELRILPLDQSSAISSGSIAWRIQPSGDRIDRALEEVPRTVPLSVMAALGSGDVLPASTSDLLQPLGGELQSGLLVPDNSGFGWRPNFLVVRKGDVDDVIVIEVAQGGGVIPPTFGMVEMPSGVSQVEIPLDPAWGGGVRVRNAGATAFEGSLELLWQRRT